MDLGIRGKRAIVRAPGKSSARPVPATSRGQNLPIDGAGYPGSQ